jgi:hypothetical protein
LPCFWGAGLVGLSLQLEQKLAEKTRGRWSSSVFQVGRYSYQRSRIAAPMRAAVQHEPERLDTGWPEDGLSNGRLCDPHGM